LQNLIDQTQALDQALRLNTDRLGDQATGFQDWARTVSQQTGIAEQSLLQAGTAAEILGRQVGFGPEQTRGLTEIAVKFAEIRGTDPSQTVNLLTQAIEGNEQAAQQLGIQLDAAFISFTRLGGATEDVFNMLNPATQAWLRAGAAAEQMASQVEKPQTPSERLNAELAKLGGTLNNFAVAAGNPVVEGLANLVGGLNGMASAVEHAGRVASTAYGQIDPLLQDLVKLAALPLIPVFAPGAAISAIPAAAQAPRPLQSHGEMRTPKGLPIGLKFETSMRGPCRSMTSRST
jgi:hypothetical protein